MRLIVTGGGSGGHVYPALAIADKFKKEIPDIEIIYIGVLNRVEADVVPKTGYHLDLIHARGIENKKIKDFIKTVKWNILGLKEARVLLKKYKPDIIVGTGGNVCFPVCFNAGLLGYRYYLHEQNAFPGFSNKMLQGHARKIFLGFKEGGKYFRNKSKLVYTGNPVRDEFTKITKEEARKKLGIPSDTFYILSFGGSLGAKKINEVSLQLLKEYTGKENVKFTFVTGKRFFDMVNETIKNENINVKDNIEILPYLYDMVTYLNAADVVIERSGALSSAEAVTTGTVAIFIPSPFVSMNHQYFNAKGIVDYGAGLMIEEKDLNGEILISKIEELRNNPKLMKEISAKALEYAPKDTADIIFNTIMNDK